MTVRKYSILISGHRTSISLEPEFYEELKRLAELKGVPLSELVREIDETRQGGLSSALRVFVLGELKK